MSIADTRPPWLPADLESLVFDRQLSFPINELRNSRLSDEWRIVDELLSTALQRRPPSSAYPSEFELRIARHHLAVELQRVLLRWCEEGLEKTLEGSFLNIYTPDLDAARKDMQVRQFRPNSMTPALSSPATAMSVFLDRQTGPMEYRPAATTDSAALVVPMKRPSEDDDTMPNKASKFYPGSEAGGEKDFRCPYNVQDPRCHTECAGKRFPNPRKLKEHIWRFTKPFKCPTCNEGFGREKTKAIHCEQRKVKCVPSMQNDYENSLEQQRDRQIDRAKNTPEIIGIFEQYERSRSTCQ